MCGILGHIGKVDQGLFLQSLNSLEHRGPDSYGVWESEDHVITLGHRRLSILDLSEKGSQPMKYKHYVIVFNGEIYNFLEIRKTLEAKGHVFYNDSDTEVIMAAYMEWGHECLHRFNGMWAFAIWDTQKRELFISRDRFGKKPFFYSQTKGSFAFGSEMKSLFNFIGEVKPSEDFSWCANHLFEYESTDKCLVHGIKRFPAGHYAYLKYPFQQINPVQFWSTDEHLETPPSKYEDQVERFKELFFDACKLRMRADVTIGTALSGGLDSSAIISTMAKIGKTFSGERIAEDWQHAFVATFPGTFLDETIYARKVIDDLKIKGEFVQVNPEHHIDSLFDQLYKFEEIYITSPAPMMETYAAVKRGGVTVTIDGHGADELLSGYGADLFLAIPDAGMNMFQVGNIISTYNNLFSKESDQTRNYRLGPKSAFKTVVSSHGGGRAMLRTMLSNKKEDPLKARGGFNTQLYNLFHKTVLPTLLRNYDRYAMASGVEIRMPFMDHRLVTYAFSLPWSSKLRNGFTKAILRDSMKGIVTDEVLWRRSKIGFNTPIVDWMKGGWKNFLLDEIHSQGFKECNLIDSTSTAKKITDVIKNDKVSFREGEQAWVALSPYLWEKALIKH